MQRYVHVGFMLSLLVGGGACRDRAQAHGSMTDFSPSFADPWQIQGRVGRASDGSLHLVYAGSAVRARFTGTAVGFDLANAQPEQQTYYGVTIDDQNARIVELSSHATHYDFDDLSAGPHTITVRKYSESGFGAGKFYGFSLPMHEQFLPMASPSGRRIEFIGDARVNGFAVESTDAGCHRDAYNENIDMAYSALSAHDLRADYRVIAAADHGVVRGGRSHIHHTLGELWQRDMAPAWQPHVVVVDATAVDFAPPAVSTAEFTQGYVHLLGEIRQAYARAYIVCIADAAPESHGPAARDAVAAAVRAFGDARVQVLEFAASASPTTVQGCEGLPSAARHREMAATLSAFVRQRMGW